MFRRFGQYATMSYLGNLAIFVAAFLQRSKTLKEIDRTTWPRLSKPKGKNYVELTQKTGNWLKIELWGVSKVK